MRASWRTNSLLAAAVLAALCGCGGWAEDAEPARIHAAASLTDVVRGIARRFEARGGAHVVIHCAASNTLAAQIRAGAPAGVFLSASPEWADDVERSGLAEPGTRADVASNGLVVVVPRGEPALASLADLAAPRFERVALADPAAVPAGRYAQAALEAAGVFARIRGKVLAAQDARTALAYAERGEAAAAIVYATDASASAAVDVAYRVPPETHPRIVYPVLLVRGAGDASRRLRAFLATEEAWEIFARAGFTKP